METVTFGYLKYYSNFQEKIVKLDLEISDDKTGKFKVISDPPEMEEKNGYYLARCTTLVYVGEFQGKSPLISKFQINDIVSVQSHYFLFIKYEFFNEKYTDIKVYSKNTVVYLKHELFNEKIEIAKIPIEQMERHFKSAYPSYKKQLENQFSKNLSKEIVACYVDIYNQSIKYTDLILDNGTCYKKFDLWVVNAKLIKFLSAENLLHIGSLLIKEDFLINRTIFTSELFYGAYGQLAIVKENNGLSQKINVSLSIMEKLIEERKDIFKQYKEFDRWYLSFLQAWDRNNYDH